MQGKVADTRQADVLSLVGAAGLLQKRPREKLEEQARFKNNLQELCAKLGMNADDLLQLDDQYPDI